MPASIAAGIVYFVSLGVFAQLKEMPSRRRHRLGAIAAGLALAGVIVSGLSDSAWRPHVLNWLPGLYLLVGYWLPAQLPPRRARRLAGWLLETDRRLFAWGLGRLVQRAPRLALEYLEAAYLCCYLVVPSGLAWLYVAGESREADRFWTAVLVASLPCYALLPWLETQPPRSVEGESDIERRRPFLRRVNLRVVNAASVGANTFPSAHAAASLAAALAVAAVTPAAGAVFAVVAGSIAAGSVVGRYHYALDAVFGMAAGIGGFLVSRFV